MIQYEETPQFKRDFKKLLKRYRSLARDLETAKKAAIELYHFQNIDNLAIFAVPGFGREGFQIYKLRKFACMALKGKGARSGIRVIYAYNGKTVTFLEIYYKGDKSDLDYRRVKEFLKE